MLNPHLRFVFSRRVKEEEDASELVTMCLNSAVDFHIAMWFCICRIE